MLEDLEVIEFFQQYPKGIRRKCIEQVLLYAVKKLKRKYKETLSDKDILNLNKNNGLSFKNEYETPRFKDSCKVEEFASLKFGVSGDSKENEYGGVGTERKTQSSDFRGFKGHVKKMPLAQKNKNDNEILKLADEFLKNPFACAIAKSNAANMYK